MLARCGDGSVAVSRACDSLLAARAVWSMTPRSRRGFFARGFVRNVPPIKKRAWGMPGAQCTRSLAGRKNVPHQQSSPRSHRKHPALPAQWFYSLLRALPGEPGLFATVAGGIASTGLTPASGCQDHTTSLSASGAFVSAPSASIASCPAFVTLRNAPQMEQDREDIGLICRFGKAEYFYLRGLTANR
jgi:hypothetical protein